LEETSYSDLKGAYGWFQRPKNKWYNNPGSDAFQGVPCAQTFTLVLVVVNHNIVRDAGGALGFPVL